jgi:hypothetical protein
LLQDLAEGAASLAQRRPLHHERDGRGGGHHRRQPHLEEGREDGGPHRSGDHRRRQAHLPAALRHGEGRQVVRGDGEGAPVAGEGRHPLVPTEVAAEEAVEQGPPRVEGHHQERADLRQHARGAVRQYESRPRGHHQDSQADRGAGQHHKPGAVQGVGQSGRRPEHPVRDQLRQVGGPGEVQERGGRPGRDAQALLQGAEAAAHIVRGVRAAATGHG